ncbi:MAG TPA: mannan-binding lectin [Gammaproteobacteria bacterium]|nr:mannan-binding lectin [Gammaproteobacteria bacterium]
MKKIVLTLISFCFIYAFPALAQNNQQQQLWSGPGTFVMPKGSYTQTCSNCSLNSNNTLLCSCADRSGTLRNTFLPNARACKYIENIDGQLTCTQKRRWPFKPNHPQTVDVQAGPIWNQPNAEQVCPSVCQNNRGTWTGQWRTTVPGQMSVCQCQLY